MHITIDLPSFLGEGGREGCVGICLHRLLDCFLDFRTLAIFHVTPVLFALFVSV